METELLVSAGLTMSDFNFKRAACHVLKSINTELVMEDNSWLFDESFRQTTVLYWCKSIDLQICCDPFGDKVNKHGSQQFWHVIASFICRAYREIRNVSISESVDSNWRSTIWFPWTYFYVFRKSAIMKFDLPVCHKLKPSEVLQIGTG